MFQELKKNISEYCEINNEYIKIKLQEEKIKGKKQKHNANDKEEAVDKGLQAGGHKLEEMSMKDEVERTIKQFVENMPEKIRQEVIDHLFVAFGIKTLKEMPHIKKKMLCILPDGRRRGQRWNDIK